jgi:hypothetical protein
MKIVDEMLKDYSKVTYQEIGDDVEGITFYCTYEGHWFIRYPKLYHLEYDIKDLPAGTRRLVQAGYQGLQEHLWPSLKACHMTFLAVISALNIRAPFPSYPGMAPDHRRL